MIARWFKLMRYIMSGGTAAIVTIGLLFVFTHYVGMWYIIAAIIANIFGLVVSFTLQKFWTFRDHSRDILKAQATTYFIIFLFNLVTNSVILYCLVEFFNLHYLLAQVVSGGMLACLSYFLYRHFVFSAQSSRAAI